MKSDKERSEEAIARMKATYQDQINQDSEMTIKEVLQFASAILSFSVHGASLDTDEYSQIGSFLLASVDTQEEGIGIQPRYKLITEYEWAMKNAARDWNNRYEMGR